MPLAGDLIDDILLRVRDTAASGTSRALVLDLLDRCQVLVVRQRGLLIRERDVNAEAERLVYDLDSTQVLGIADIYIGDKRLSQIRWPHFGLIDRAWWRNFTEDGPDSWARLGTNYFIIHPGFAADGAVITVREQRRPTQLLNEDVAIDIPNEHIPYMLDLTEALLYLRHRDQAIEAVFARIDPNTT